MDDQGATQDAADAAKNAIDAVENVAEKAVDLTADTARDLLNAAIKMQQRVVDAILGKE